MLVGVADGDAVRPADPNTNPPLPRVLPLVNPEVMGDPVGAVDTTGAAGMIGTPVKTMAAAVVAAGAAEVDGRGIPIVCRAP